jgi:hypothetical protein
MHPHRAPTEVIDMLRPRPALVLLGLGLAGLAQAQYRIDWYTVDGGGGTSTGGPYSLSGTIGQPDADVVSLCSADGGPGCVNPTFELTGGFWVASATPPSVTCGADLNCIFRDGFEPQP